MNEQLPPVRGDRVQLQQVLLNLITNAIDSMAATNGARGLCVKSTVHESGGVMVSVEDSRFAAMAKIQGTTGRPEI